MPAGRPSKPLERKRATGRTPTTDSGGRKLPAVRTEVDKTVVVPPSPTGLKERGEVEWANIWTAGAAWLHPDQDYPWVEIIARAWDEIEAFRERVEADGLIQKGSQGQVIAHPLIAEVRRAESVIMKALSTLGFSPSDRARLGLAEIKRQSALKDFMKGF